ncbi:MAG: glycosyltransferase family 2 protein [Oscillospiraceae bacterium]|nr:glycosyltransferase family 2 protein [Oscillospiraceae bacterium]MBR2890694.1 glycosyltransferase family 2 protein [Oscillospiraceae bacterium]
MKLLTVTVPCYNSEAYMEKCIDSLLTGGDRVEIIVIDDGSKDSTGAIGDRYAAQYPDIVRVIHQENGGHGEGINQGLKHATGKYFKVVDSDDEVSGQFVAFLDALESCDRAGGVDLFVTNYYYVHTDGIGDRSINYSNVLPQNRIFGWSDTKRFRLHQMLTIHSCTFRTEAMRRCGTQLPKKVFYEDNLMVCRTLPYVDKMFYMDIDLYRYTIGREGQSVQDDVSRRRYTHHLQIAEMAFKSVDLNQVSNKQKKAYMKHELFMLFGIATIFSRLNKNEEADAALEQMWKNCRAHDEAWADFFRKRTVLTVANAPGKAGQTITSVVYKAANKVVRFN